MLYELLIPDAINSVLIQISPFICHRGKSREVWRMKRENNYNIQHEWIHLCFLTKHWSSNLSWQSHLVALTHFDQCLVMLYLAVKAYQGLFYPGKACSSRQGSAGGTQSESYSRKVQHPSIGQSLKKKKKKKLLSIENPDLFFFFCSHHNDPFRECSRNREAEPQSVGQWWLAGKTAWSSIQKMGGGVNKKKTKKQAPGTRVVSLKELWAANAWSEEQQCHMFNGGISHRGSSFTLWVCVP